MTIEEAREGTEVLRRAADRLYFIWLKTKPGTCEHIDILAACDLLDEIRFGKDGDLSIEEFAAQP